MEVSLLPSGMVMVRGTMAGLMFIAGASVVKKWAVAPVLLIVLYVFSCRLGCGGVCIVLRVLWIVATWLVLDVAMVMSSSSSSQSSMSARRAKQFELGVGVNTVVELRDVLVLTCVSMCIAPPCQA